MFSVDVAITAAVLYPVGSLGRSIEFTTSVEFTEKEMYYVTMDPGIIKIGIFCESYKRSNITMVVNALLLHKQEVEHRRN